MIRRFLVTFTVATLLTAGLCFSQTLYTWDANSSTADGITNGTGTWNTTNTNWFDGTNDVVWLNDGTVTAQFGGAPVVVGNTITVSGTMNAAGINFLAISGTLVGTSVYNLSGGTINLADNALLQMADTSSYGSGFATIGSNLNAKNLTIQKSGGTAIQYLSLNGAGSLTGTLTIKGTGGGVFASIHNTYAAVNTLDQIVVESGSNFDAAVSTGGTVSVPFTLAGNGGASTDYGAIRVDVSNTTFSGPFKLSADASLKTNFDVMNTVLSGGISELSAGLGFTRDATSGISTLYFAAPSTYTGATQFGRAGSSSYQGGVSILDFSAATAPSTNILYHGVAAGPLNLVGGSGSTTALVLRGATGSANSQTFGNLTASGPRSSVALTPGTSGTMSLSLGTITHTATASVPGLLDFSIPAGGTITTTSPNGFLGSWATVTDATGKASWAAVVNGTVAGFSGTVPYVTGNTLANLSASPTTTDFRVDATSTGSITPGSGTSSASTITFADSGATRLLDIGTGNILRLAATGGVQMLTGASVTTIGAVGTPGTLTAGGTANTAGQIILTNFSTNALTVNSAIANNGTGAVAVVVDGSGPSVFSAPNTYTGQTTVASGSLEISNSSALGTTAGGTLVLQGAALRLNGNLTIAEALTIAGTGLANDGVIRNVAGNSTINNLITLYQISRINADASSTLNITRSGGTPTTTTAISSSFALTLGGSGNIIVGGPMALSSATPFAKDGTGTVTLRGTNVFAGATSVLGGTLNLDFPNATVSSNILYNGVTAGALTLGGGTLRVTANATTATSQAFGAPTIAAGESQIAVSQNGSPGVTLTLGAFSRSAAGGVVDLTLPTTGNMTTTGGTNNTLVSVSAVTFATIGGTDWAATDSTATNRNLVGLSTISGGYTASTATALSSGSTINADIASGVTTTTLAGSGTTTMASLRFNQAQATTITQGATGRILSTGGILVTPNVGANLTTISVSSLRTQATSTGLDLVIIQNNTAGDLLINSAIVADGSANALTKAGPGKVILTGANTYSGVTRILDGALQLRGGSLAATTDVVLGGGTSNGKLILGDTAAVNSTVNSIQTYGFGTASAVVGGASTISTLTLAGTATTAFPTGTSAFTAGTLGGSGTIENNLAVTVTGGVLQLGGSNTYVGDTRIASGTIEASVLANGGQPSSLGAATSPVVLGSATSGAVVATLRYVGTTLAQTDRAIAIDNSGSPTSIMAQIDSSGLGAVQFTSSFTATGSSTTARTLVLTGSNSGANVIQGISDAPAAATNLEKTGTGKWQLAGASTATGFVHVKAGTLVVSGSISGTLTVGDPSYLSTAAVLGGSGTVGDVTATGNGTAASSGADVSPGDSPGLAGILHTRAFSLTAGAHLDLEIGGITAGGNSAAGYDQIITSGNLDFTGGDLKLTLLGTPAFQSGDTLFLAINNSSSAMGGSFATLNGAAFDPSNFFLNGQQFQLVYGANYSGAGSDGVSNDLALVAVPEPGAWASLLGGFTMLCWLRRRQPIGQSPRSRGQ